LGEALLSLDRFLSAVEQSEKLSELDPANPNEILSACPQS